MSFDTAGIETSWYLSGWAEGQPTASSGSKSSGMPRRLHLWAAFHSAIRLSPELRVPRFQVPITKRSSSAPLQLGN